MSIDDSSRDYKHFKYTRYACSINHPSCEYENTTDHESINPISKTRSEYKIKSPTTMKSFFSEPIKNTSFLTEELLAKHNTILPPFHHLEYVNKEPEQRQDANLLDQIDEKCKSIQQEFDFKMKKLEAQLQKTEQDFVQSQNDIKELHNIEKEYLDNGVQTDLYAKDVNQLEQLDAFVQETRKIVWDTSFIPINSICRQLPTHDESDDEDVCDYHRQKIENYKQKLQTEKSLYQNDHHATLKRIQQLASRPY